MTTPMSTHLYCVLPGDAPDVPDALHGIDSGLVRALPVDGLVAWVSDVERNVPVSIEGVRAHDAVVEAALELGATPLPARFGQRFSGDDACREALSKRRAVIETLLSSIQGLVEMTILITPSTRRMLRELEPVIPEMFEPDVTGTGRKYLETLRSREAATGSAARATDALARRVGEATGTIVRKSLNHLSGPFRTISNLLSREDVAEFKRAVALVDRGLEFQFLVIGPRAPYSFSALKSDNGGVHGMNLAD
jgi:hypothetical protein